LKIQFVSKICWKNLNFIEFSIKSEFFINWKIELSTKWKRKPESDKQKRWVIYFVYFARIGIAWPKHLNFVSWKLIWWQTTELTTYYRNLNLKLSLGIPNYVIICRLSAINQLLSLLSFCPVFGQDQQNCAKKNKNNYIYLIINFQTFSALTYVKMFMTYL
jgi:hypothetical protein